MSSNDLVKTYQNTSNLILSVLISNPGGLNEVEFYEECRLLFGIDFDERLGYFDCETIDDFIIQHKIEDIHHHEKKINSYGEQNKNPFFRLKNFVQCVKADPTTRQVLPSGRWFYKLKSPENWPSTFHKNVANNMLNLTCLKKEYNYPRNYEDIMTNSRFRFDVKNNRMLDCRPLRGNYDPEAPQPDFVPFALRMNVRTILSSPEFIRVCPTRLEKFALLYRKCFGRSLQEHSCSPIYQNYQILCSLGKDVVFDKEYKWDQESGKYIKYMLIEPGNYITNKILIQNPGANFQILGTVDHMKNQSFLNFDELYLKTYKNVMTILLLNPEAINFDKRTNKTTIDAKKFDKNKQYGVIGIKPEEIYDVYYKLFKQRLPYPYLGFKNYVTLLKIMMQSTCLITSSGKFYLKK